MRRYGTARLWSSLATVLTAFGCVGLLGGIVGHRSWAMIAGVVFLCASAAANITGILITRHSPRDP
jgi:hypothetical protein